MGPPRRVPVGPCQGEKRGKRASGEAEALVPAPNPSRLGSGLRLGASAGAWGFGSAS